MQQDFFKGMRVLELASVLAGPAVGMFFAELGATVIKVENKRSGGDVTRNWRVSGETNSSAFSAYYSSVNYGKESHLLDLGDAEDQRTLRHFLAQTDILISNFRPAAARRFGVHWEQLREQYPRLIYAQLYAFGKDSDRPAFDVVLQAETGFLSMCGTREGELTKMPVALIDLLAGHQLKEGILLALLRREREQRGSLVEVSLFDAAIASLANQATNWLIAGRVPDPMGTQHPNIAPYGDLFWTKDQFRIVLAAGTEAQYRALCELLHLPDLATQDRFATNAARVKHRKALWELLQRGVGAFPRDTLLSACAERGIPIGAVRPIDEVFAQQTAQQLLLRYALPDNRVVEVPRSVVFRISEG